MDEERKRCTVVGTGKSWSDPRAHVSIPPRGDPSSGEQNCVGGLVGQVGQQSNARYCTVIDHQHGDLSKNTLYSKSTVFDGE